MDILRAHKFCVDARNMYNLVCILYVRMFKYQIIFSGALVKRIQRLEYNNVSAAEFSSINALEHHDCMCVRIFNRSCDGISFSVKDRNCFTFIVDIVNAAFQLICHAVFKPVQLDAVIYRLANICGKLFRVILAAYCKCVNHVHEAYSLVCIINVFMLAINLAACDLFKHHDICVESTFRSKCHCDVLCAGNGTRYKLEPCRNSIAILIEKCFTSCLIHKGKVHVVNTTDCKVHIVNMVFDGNSIGIAVNPFCPCGCNACHPYGLVFIGQVFFLCEENLALPDLFSRNETLARIIRCIKREIHLQLAGSLCCKRGLISRYNTFIIAVGINQMQLTLHSVFTTCCKSGVSDHICKSSISSTRH